MAKQASGCFKVVLASGTSDQKLVVAASAKLMVFNGSRLSEQVAVHTLETKQLFKQWPLPFKRDTLLRRYIEDLLEGTRQWTFDDRENFRKASRCKGLSRWS